MKSKHEITRSNIKLKIGEPLQDARFRPFRNLLCGPLMLIALLAFSPIAAHSQSVDKIGICFGSGASLLVPLAQKRDFFVAEGISAEMYPFPSGKQAMEAMFSGKCALAVAAETPVAHYSLLRNDFSIVASIAVSNNFERIIVRSDRGITDPANLSGRRIAVPEFTTAHYFLDLYLAANGLAQQDVAKVYLPAQDVLEAFRRGDVDAVVHWEPNIQLLAKEFGVKAKVFSSPGLHVSPFLLIGNRDYLRKYPVAVERILRALLRAERWLKEQPVKARAMMENVNSGGAEELELLWSLNDFKVTLDQSLLFILENTARWEIGLMPPSLRPALPNYLNYIYTDGLTTVKPAAVTIIH